MDLNEWRWHGWPYHLYKNFTLNLFLSLFFFLFFSIYRSPSVLSFSLSFPPVVLDLPMALDSFWACTRLEGTT